MENYIGFQVHYIDSNGYFTGASKKVPTVSQARAAVEKNYSEEFGWTIEYRNHFSGVITKDNQPWNNLRFSIRGVDKNYQPHVL